jgi:hypothetical protein
VNKHPCDALCTSEGETKEIEKDKGDGDRQGESCEEICQSISEDCRGCYMGAPFCAIGFVEDHDKAADDAQVAQEEIEMECLTVQVK